MDGRDGLLGVHAIHRAWQAHRHLSTRSRGAHTQRCSDGCVRRFVHRASAARAYSGSRSVCRMARFRAALFNSEDERARNLVFIRPSKEGLWPNGGVAADLLPAFTGARSYMRSRMAYLHAGHPSMTDCGKPLTRGQRLGSRCRLSHPRGMQPRLTPAIYDLSSYELRLEVRRRRNGELQPAAQAARSTPAFAAEVSD
jgi:hypothetical protein